MSRYRKVHPAESALRKRREPLLRLWRAGYLSKEELKEQLSHTGFRTAPERDAWIAHYTSPNYKPRKRERKKAKFSEFLSSDAAALHTGLATLDDLRAMKEGRPTISPVESKRDICTLKQDSYYPKEDN